MSASPSGYNQINHTVYLAAQRLIEERLVDIVPSLDEQFPYFEAMVNVGWCRRAILKDGTYRYWHPNEMAIRYFPDTPDSLLGDITV